MARRAVGYLHVWNLVRTRHVLPKITPTKSCCHLGRVLFNRTTDLESSLGIKRCATEVQSHIHISHPLSIIGASITNPAILPPLYDSPQRYHKELLHTFALAIQIEERPLSHLPLMIIDNDRGPIIRCHRSDEDAAEERTQISRKLLARLVCIFTWRLASHGVLIFAIMHDSPPCTRKCVMIEKLIVIRVKSCRYVEFKSSQTWKT